MQAPAAIFSLCLIINGVLGLDLSGLQDLLSPKASIAYNTSGASRWSEFPRPNPGAIVNVATEEDVQVTIQYCARRDIPFLVQGGGHGCSTTFTLSENGVVIDLAQLNHARVNTDGTELWFEGGALVSDVVAAAYAKSTIVTTPSCNCIGQLGAGLGAGYGNMVGLYGLIIDNLLSVSLVTADGQRITITPETEPSLWFAVRGAGPNYGIVTSATIRSYPVAKEKSGPGLDAWLATLTFSEEKLEDLIRAVDTLVLKPELTVNLVFSASGSSGNDISTSITLSLFYYGSDAAARKAFSSIYDLGPETDDAGIFPYNRWNEPQDGGCAKGGRKQRFGAGLARMVPGTWRKVYSEYKAFVQKTGAVKSAVIMNGTPLPPDTHDDSAYPYRHLIKFNTWAQPSVGNPSLDEAAKAWALRARDLLRSTAGLDANSTYVNGGYGDETLSVIYGDNVERLKSLKHEWDPHGRFNQWFPL